MNCLNQEPRESDDLPPLQSQDVGRSKTNIHPQTTTALKRQY